MAAMLLRPHRRRRAVDLGVPYLPLPREQPQYADEEHRHHQSEEHTSELQSPVHLVLVDTRTSRRRRYTDRSARQLLLDATSTGVAARAVPPPPPNRPPLPPSLPPPAITAADNPKNTPSPTNLTSPH